MSTESLQLKNPIVLVHGLGARSTYGPIEYFYGLNKLLKDAKNELLIVNLTSWHTIEHRASQLKEQIEKVFPEGQINLVGHSMGGLDARFLTSQLGFADRVTSVTTIGTPNRGTSVGDIATGLLPSSMFVAADHFLKLMDSSSGAFRQITREYCRGEFATLTPNAPQVAYYSATSAIASPVMLNSLPVFWLTNKILSKLEGDNDGFVSVESAMWGDHICTYSGDHYSQIGQFLGRARGMDYMKFYKEIFSHLKKEGM
jgi:triacylglycerol lipase